MEPTSRLNDKLISERLVTARSMDGIFPKECLICQLQLVLSVNMNNYLVSRRLFYT